MSRKGYRWWLGLVTENFWWKVLSLLIAVVLWALVASEPELLTTVNVSVEYKNLPDDLEISSAEPGSSVALDLRGPSGELRGVGDRGVHPAVILDMSSVTPGERTFPIGDGNVRGLTRGVYLVRAVPSEIRFRFERRATRTVPVEVRVTGDGHGGYNVVSTQADPPQMTIVGPSSDVAKIERVTTDPVDVSNVVGTQQFHVNAFVANPYVRFESSPQVVVTVTMKKM